FQAIARTDSQSRADAFTTFSECEFKHYTNALHDGRLYRCSPSVYMPCVPPSERSATDNGGSGITLRSERYLREAIRDYLHSKDPLLECLWCNGSRGETFPHVLERKDVIAMSK